VFHNTEGDWDLVSTYRDLKRQWCDNIEVSVRWVKGHADWEGRPLTKYEQLNAEADLLADQMRQKAIEVYGARPNCPHWPIEKVMMFIRRKKITNNMKYHLTSQLNDPKLRAHIMAKEEWSEHTFDNVDWTAFETAFKRLSKSRQTAVSVVTTCGAQVNEMGKFIEARNNVTSATRRKKTGTTSFHAGH
jgi:hypothetical protein